MFGRRSDGSQADSARSIPFTRSTMKALVRSLDPTRAFVVKGPIRTLRATGVQLARSDQGAGRRVVAVREEPRHPGGELSDPSDERAR